ncbi:MAG TPA: HAMP domain-containing sensor histidine kinase [Sphingomonas sp.]
MVSRPDDPVHARVDAEGRLVSADPRLADLHARAGGEPGGTLAIPQLAAMARLARRLGVPVARGVLAADGEDDLDLWVRARPDGEIVALTVAGWSRRPIAPAIAAGPDDSAARDFVRAEADWAWRADAALRLTALSREAPAALIRAAGEAMPGDPLTRLFVLEEAAGGGLPLLEALASGRGFDAQFVTLRGTTARFRLAGTPLLDPLGRVKGFDGAGFAVMAADAGDAQPAVAADDGAFARRLDTALRTPLNRIVAAAESIREQDEGPLRADYGGYAGDIANAGRHLLGLVDDLVDLEAVERDPDIDPEPIDMADLARRAAGLLSVKADDRTMRIERPAETVTLPCVGDFRRALQVMVNLISNAVRFGPAGSTVHVLVEPREGMAAAMVVDAGRGVAPADRERAFEKFERLGATEPGSGLGLYISRRLARAMGGDLVIEDAPGAGACFVFTLPAGQIPAGE